MSELFDKSIRTLELPTVLQMLADQTNSGEARDRALKIAPQTDPEASRWRRACTGRTGAAR